MRLISLFFVLSLAVNVGLAVAWNSARTSRSGIAGARQAARQVKAVAGGESARFEPGRLTSALESGNAAELLAQLRALGVSEGKAVDFANRFIWLKYDTRRRELLAAKNNDGNVFNERTAAAQLTAAERGELRELANQASRESLELLGAATIDGIEAIAKRYDFLPAEKVAQLQYLQRDYAEMRADIIEESARFKLPSDAKQLAILGEEYRKDLASLLTPEELTAYDERFSPTASLLRRTLAGMDITEAEYRAVFDAVKPTMGFERYANLDDARKRELVEARQQSVDAIYEILGDERTDAYRRARTIDYNQLLAAADRFNLPAETINGVFELRGVAESESRRIATDSALSAGEKAQALQALAESIRGQVRAQLGEEIGDAYLQKGMAWLRHLSDGASVEFTQAGIIRYKRVAPAAKSGAAK